MEESKVLNSELQQCKSAILQVSKSIKLIGTNGNPNNFPAIILHPGPGAGSPTAYARTFDQSAYRNIKFDQRGFLKSEPFACLKENTTFWNY